MTTSIEKLPSDISKKINSFLTAPDLARLSGTCKAVRKLARKSIANTHYPQLINLPRDSYLGARAQALRISLTPTEGQCIELVKKVVTRASRAFRRYEEKGEMKERGDVKQSVRTAPQNPISCLSYKQINSIEADRNLLLAFDKISAQIPEVRRPELNKNSSHNALIVRTWMRENANLLARITELDLYGLNLTTLPSEISLLNNLRILILRNTQIAALPAGFNPPELRILELENTPMRPSLPALTRLT